MNPFETLIFVPEGSLLNEKLAIKSSLRETVKYFTGTFGPAENLKYSQLSTQFKLMSEQEQIAFLLQNFLPDFTETAAYFDSHLRNKARLVKGSLDFLKQVKGKTRLLLYSKEKQEMILPRLKKAGLIDLFEGIYFADDFTAKLPQKEVLLSIITQSNSDPDTSLVIGTNLSEEIQGAENAGLKSLWLAPKKEKIPITPHPTLHLSRLSDLLFYLNIE